MTYLQSAISEAYKANLINRTIIDLELELNNRLLPYKSVGGVVILLCKIVLGKLILLIKREREVNYNAFTWSAVHDNRLSDLERDLIVLRYSLTRMSLYQFEILGRVPIALVIQRVVNILSSDSRSQTFSDHSMDSVFYRVLFAIEYSFFEHYIGKQERIYIAGLNDRYSIMISSLCKSYAIELHMLQHGLLAFRESQFLVPVSVYYYLYEFSLPALKYNICEFNDLVFLPKKSSRLFDSIFDSKAGANIAFATLPAFHESNLMIIKTLLEVIEKCSITLNLLIYVHPLDVTNKYSDLAKYNEHVFICDERHQNLLFTVSQCSTIGVEYLDQGIDSLFVNLHNFNSDLVFTDSFLVVSSIEELEKLAFNLVNK